MVDTSGQILDASPVDDLLRMFQAATKRGQKVSHFLESRGRETFSTFKCSSAIGGVPVEKQHKKKSLNPSQLRRSQASQDEEIH